MFSIYHIGNNAGSFYTRWPQSCRVALAAAALQADVTGLFVNVLLVRRLLGVILGPIGAGLQCSWANGPIADMGEDTDRDTL